MVKYNFTANNVIMSFFAKDVINFQLTSVEIKYDFQDFEIINFNETLSSSSKIEFSIKSINRHAFHDKYTCKTTVCDLSTSQEYAMEFSIKIPHFESKTEIKFGFMDPNFPGNEIVSIFNHDFKDSSSLTCSEIRLLNDLQ